MYICNYIASYNDNVLGRRVALWQRGNYLYELSHAAQHIRWFHDMSLEDVHKWLAENYFTPA